MFNIALRIIIILMGFCITIYCVLAILWILALLGHGAAFILDQLRSLK